MRSAAGVWRLSVGLGLAIYGVVVIGFGAAFRTIDFDVGIGSLLSFCAGYVLPEPEASSIAVVLMGSFGLAVVTLSLRAAWRFTRVSRFGRYLKGPLEMRVIDSHRVQVFDDATPRAMCVGILRPAIYMSTGALRALDGDELSAVIAHEAHHARRYDAARLLLINILCESLFFVPAMRRMRDRCAALTEVAADAAAVAAVGNVQPLASAMLRFGETSDPDVVAGIANERVDHLLGRRRTSFVPPGVLATTFITLVGLVGAVAGTAIALQPGALPASELATQFCMTAMTIGPISAGATTILFVLRHARAAV